MKSLLRRVERLDRKLAPPRDYARNPRERLRVIVSEMDHPLRLDTSHCTRMLCPDGTLLETVSLDGFDDLTTEQLSSFVDRFPIQILGGAPA